MTLRFVDLSTGEGVALHPRNWVAAYDALSSAGPYEVGYRSYWRIFEFIAGFAVATTLPMS